MAAFTEKAIVDTFIGLLNEKPLDKITVKDIIDKCGVNRSTFYYYFEDIYDLLNKIFETETARIVEGNKEYDSWVNSVTSAMEFIIDNKKAILHIYRSVNRERLEKYIATVMDSVIMWAVRSQSQDTKASEEDIRLVCDVYKYTMIGLTTKWLDEGIAEEPVKLIEKLGFILEGTMHRMLERAGQFNNQ